ncbi:hypothetical protein SLS58_010566 [Diplodia intermedia]|uniref:Uncharacterized protein n=1 Tax=Diplodia intermedia TaxID=856260 RepID=A0ABR3T5B4_9PEZI
MSQSPSRETLPMQLTLPHPWHTTYTIKVGAYDEGLRQFQVQPTNSTTKPGHQQLHKEDLFWTEPNPAPDASGQESIPVSRIFWGKSRPSIGQAWLAAYGLITLYPSTDAFLITLQGDKSDDVANELCRVGLLAKSPSTSTTADHYLFRGSFWQGAGSPFGPRPVWLAANQSARQQTSAWEYPPPPLQQQYPSIHPDDQPTPSTTTLTTPLRPPKPAPGTPIYTRPIPSLPNAPHLTLRVPDPTNASHITAIDSWIPHGTRDAHESHLLAATRDASTLPVLAFLGATPLAYFELCWLIDRVADEQGVHYPAGLHDRGIENVLFAAETAAGAAGAGAGAGEGAKLSLLLWGAAVHYAFLDEPRTGAVYGAPRGVGVRGGFRSR